AAPWQKECYASKATHSHPAVATSSEPACHPGAFCPGMPPYLWCAEPPMPIRSTQSASHSQPYPIVRSELPTGASYAAHHDDSDAAWGQIRFRHGGTVVRAYFPVGPAPFPSVGMVSCFHPILQHESWSKHCLDGDS